jgi:PAS domain S-box-containing protein
MFRRSRGGGRAAEELRARAVSEAPGAQFEVVLRGVAEAITVQDRERRLVFANETAARMLGYDSPEALLDANPEERLAEFELLDDAGNPLPLEELPGRRVLAGHEGEEQTVHYRIRETGEERWSIVRAAPIAGSDGRTELTINTFHDITDRVRAERRLAFLADVSTVLASSLDYETTLARVAQLAVPRLADWCTVDMLDEAGEIKRLTVAHRDPSKVAWANEFADRFPMDADARYGVPNVIRTARSELFEEVPQELDLAATTGDPGLIRILRELGLKSSMCVPLIARGRVLGAITLLTEQAGRRLTLHDLAEAEELARRAAIAVDNARLFHEAERRADAARVLAYVGDGVFLLDGDGVVRLWNRAAETITGLTAREVVGRPVAEAVPGWSALAEHVPIAAAPGAGTRAETLPLELPDRELWLSISGVGFLEGIVYAFRDLTEERALEQLKSDFVSTVSHELRTPLAAIYGAALTLRRGDLSLNDQQRENLLAVVANEADRLARTVNDILWTSRLDSGTLQVAIESCDATLLAADVVAAARTYLPENIELQLAVPPAVPHVAGDPDKVRQVLANLVENAVKYSPDGGRVDVSIQPDDGTVRFSVHDQGLGVPPPEQRRIFDKFYRLDPEMTRGVGGTGLGLYICRELVRRMEGRIWVESREGSGSTFAFELPAAG